MSSVSAFRRRLGDLLFWKTVQGLTALLDDDWSRESRHASGVRHLHCHDRACEHPGIRTVRNDFKRARSLVMNRAVCLPASTSVSQRKEFPVRPGKSSVVGMLFTALSVMLEGRRKLHQLCGDEDQAVQRLTSAYK